MVSHSLHMSLANKGKPGETAELLTCQTQMRFCYSLTGSSIYYHKIQVMSTGFERIGIGASFDNLTFSSVTSIIK